MGEGRRSLVSRSRWVCALIVSCCFLHLTGCATNKMIGERDSLRGCTRAELIERFGKPTRHYFGHYGRPAPIEYRKAHPICETLVFTLPKGELFVAVEPRFGHESRLRAAWVCFDSSYPASDATF